MKLLRITLLAAIAASSFSSVASAAYGDVYDVDRVRLVTQSVRVLETPSNLEPNRIRHGYPSTDAGAILTWTDFNHVDGYARFSLKGILVNNFTDVYGGCVRLVVHYGTVWHEDLIVEQCQPAVIFGLVPIYKSFIISGHGSTSDPIDIRVESRRYWTQTWTLEQAITRAPGD